MSGTMAGASRGNGGTKATGGGCPESARVRMAVRQSLSEETLSLVFFFSSLSFSRAEGTSRLLRVVCSRGARPRPDASLRAARAVLRGRSGGGRRATRDGRRARRGAAAFPRRRSSRAAPLLHAPASFRRPRSWLSPRELFGIEGIRLARTGARGGSRAHAGRETRQGGHAGPRRAPPCPAHDPGSEEPRRAGLRVRRLLPEGAERRLHRGPARGSLSHEVSLRPLRIVVRALVLASFDAALAPAGRRALGAPRRRRSSRFSR